MVKIRVIHLEITPRNYHLSTFVVLSGHYSPPNPANKIIRSTIPPINPIIVFSFL